MDFYSLWRLSFSSYRIQHLHLLVVSNCVPRSLGATIDTVSVIDYCDGLEDRCNESDGADRNMQNKRSDIAKGVSMKELPWDTFEGRAMCVRTT